MIITPIILSPTQHTYWLKCSSMNLTKKKKNASQHEAIGMCIVILSKSNSLGKKTRLNYLNLFAIQTKNRLVDIE